MVFFKTLTVVSSHKDPVRREQPLKQQSFLLLMNGNSIQQRSTFDGNTFGCPLLLKRG